MEVSDMTRQYNPPPSLLRSLRRPSARRRLAAIRDPDPHAPTRHADFDCRRAVTIGLELHLVPVTHFLRIAGDPFAERLQLFGKAVRRVHEIEVAARRLRDMLG